MGIVGGNSMVGGRDVIAYLNPWQDRLPCDLRPPVLYNSIDPERRCAAKRSHPEFTETRSAAPLTTGGFSRFANSISHFIILHSDFSPKGEHNA